MKRVKKTGKRTAPAEQPQETAAEIHERSAAQRRYRATEALKRPLLAGQCPHTDNNYCEHCIGD